MQKTLPSMTILRKKDQDYNILRDQVLRYYSEKISLVDQLNLYVLRRCNFENLCILNANRFLENHRIPSLHTPVAYEDGCYTSLEIALGERIQGKMNLDIKFSIVWRYII